MPRSSWRVVLDACVIFSAVLRDTLGSTSVLLSTQLMLLSIVNCQLLIVSSLPLTINY